MTENCYITLVRLSNEFDKECLLNVVKPHSVVMMSKYAHEVLGNFENCKNIIITNDIEYEISRCSNGENVYVIGYDCLIKKALPYSHSMYNIVLSGSSFFNPYQKDWVVESVDFPTDKMYMVVKYRRYSENLDEYQYLDLVRNILDNGTRKGNRTGVDTISIFGHSSKWSLKNNTLPLLTTKKVFTKGIVEELLWFISGSTDSKILESKGVNIWKGNTTRQFLDSRGLQDLREGDIGAGYGFQWRHSGAEYNGCDKDYTNAGVDQLKDIVETLKKDPNSRRMLMCSWNPSALSKMALPPCHVLFQLYTETVGEDIHLHSSMYQRSADVGLGVPFNIASYSLLTIMLAHCCGYLPGTFTYFTGDTHIYENHIEPLKKQLCRVPLKFPTVSIKENKKDLFSLTSEDIVIKDYRCYEIIKMDMVV